MTLCIQGIWWIFEDTLPIVIYTGHSVLSPANFNKCVSSDTKIKGTSVSISRSIHYISMSTWLSSSVSPYWSLPPPVLIVNFCIIALWWCISVEAMLIGVHEMIRVGGQPHQASSAFDDVSTTVFDRVLVIVIPSHILKSV